MKINFHQNPYDSPERFWKFYGKQGDFLSAFINRIQWYEYPLYHFVSDFPLHVDIETSSKCNMSCPMCFRKNLKESGQMDWETFCKVVDECKEMGIYSIRLSWRGEALTHPRIFDMIEYSIEKIPNVSFLTNTFLVTEKVADFLVDVGLSYIGCSFDGIGSIYNRIRSPAKFEESYENLRYLKSRRDKLGRAKPRIRVCSIWPAVSNDPQAYYDRMSKVSDLIVVNNYKNFSAPPAPIPDFVCQYPWERLIVAFNGRVQCCTGWNSDDISLGNVAEKSLCEMWHGDKLNRLRSLHREGRRLELESCSICRHGNELTDQSISIEEIIERGF